MKFGLAGWLFWDARRLRLHGFGCSRVVFSACTAPTVTLQTFWNFGGNASQDVETGMLYPGADSLDNALRWGFIRKARHLRDGFPR